MQFYGDGHSPGENWIRTDLGWRRLREIGSHLNAHLVHQLQLIGLGAGSAGPRRSPKSLSRKSTPLGGSIASSPDAQHSESKGREQHLRRLNLMLSQRCVSSRKSSKESNHYTTISDAVNKLNFAQALNDDGCYPFVCQVVTLLYEHRFWVLSGSMQTTLLRVTELAKEIAGERLHYTGLVVEMIDKAVKTLEKGRRQHLTGFSARSTDTRIKTLLKSKRQLQDTLHNGGWFHVPLEQKGWSLSDLPSDCLRHVISFLGDPMDVASLGQTCSKLHSLTEENLLWKEMTVYHYGRDKLSLEEEVRMVSFDAVHWKSIFVKEYRLTRGKLRGETSGAICICQLCLFVYWKAYGHPCSALTSRTGSAGSSTSLHSSHTALPQLQQLTAREFLALFSC